MTEYEINYPFVILLIGSVIILTILLKGALQKIGVPPLVGYLVLGFLLSLANQRWQILRPASGEIFGFLAEIGLITLLFRVGLESDLHGLLAQLRRASLVWMANVGVSGLIGLVTAVYLLDLTWITGTIVAAAFTATSVGISVAVWEEQGCLKTSRGELLVDVAELDDISAVVIMALLFALLPVLRGGGENTALLPTAGWTLGLFTLKLVLFGCFCFLFSRYLERPITDYFRDLTPASDAMLVVAAIGFIIAAFADLLGFSLAIGAFFAGLVFSRDPDAVKMEASFLPLYEFFSPFFFIGIGMDLDPSGLVTALGPGLVLFGAAVVSKLAANVLPVWLMTDLKSGILIGVSMVPRAEIAMIIMHRGLKLGDWAVPSKVYGAVVLVSALTCVGAPLIVRRLLATSPQEDTS